MAASKPYAGTELQKLIDKRLYDLRDVKSQRDITLEVYSKMTSIVSMIRSGEAKVGLEKVAKLAKALETDEIEFFRLALKQHFTDPDMIALVDRAVVGVNYQGTDADREWLGLIHEITGGANTVPTETMKREIRKTLAPLLDK